MSTMTVTTQWRKSCSGWLAAGFLEGVMSRYLPKLQAY